MKNVWRFSIIIPVRTINDFIRENIAHLKQLEFGDFEAIIITDAKEQYDFGDNRFFLLDSGNVGPGEKRNIGAKHATGEILTFLDDDAYPSPTWLTEASTIFADPKVYALGGPFDYNPKPIVYHHHRDVLNTRNLWLTFRPIIR